MTRVVLDTNTVVSALLFTGIASRLVPQLQARRIALLVSPPIVDEYLRVLAYPKFELNDEEIEGLLRDELLPFLMTVRSRRRLSVVRRDPDDDKFLECAVAGKARYLVTGDRALLEIGRFRRVTMTTVGSLLRDLEARGTSPPR